MRIKAEKIKQREIERKGAKKRKKKVKNTD